MEYIIQAGDGKREYGKAATWEPVKVTADSFKVNDQGTVVFFKRGGDAVAAFKSWHDIKEVVR